MERNSNIKIGLVKFTKEKNNDILYLIMRRWYFAI